MQGQDAADVARRRLSEGVHEGRVDVAVLQADPRFIEGPRPVHLDVGLVDRRPRTDRIEGGDEGEGLTLEVVAAAGDGEANVVLREPRALPDLLDHRHEDLDLVVPLVPTDGGRLGHGDDGDVPHRWCL